MDFIGRNSELFNYSTLEYLIPSVCDFVKNRTWAFSFILLIVFMLFRLIQLNLFQQPNSIIVPRRNEIPMVQYYSPFYFDVDLSIASYKGIECTIKCDKDCYILGVWGVPIGNLIELMSKRLTDIKKSIITQDVKDKFTSKCKWFNNLIFISSGEKRTLVFKLPGEFTEFELLNGQRFDRHMYPFVAIMILKNEADIQDHLMVAQATVVHLKDRLLPSRNTVVCDIVKPEFGCMGIVRKTFAASEPLDVGGVHVGICRVCYEYVINCTILPCRHSCICTVCLENVTICPICRGSAFSYFKI